MLPAQPPLYPLHFEPIYKEKIWGGRTLTRLGRSLPGHSDTPIGESWELVDLATTSVSGGGGAEERSVVARGPLAGKTLNELMQQYGSELLGSVQPTESGGFPLLLKFLDARKNLSVQVHPSPDYAARHPDAFLKSEAWYILDAEPGAVIYKGLKPHVTPEQFREALGQNTDEAVVPLLQAIPVQRGDCHYLPSGTCHALGAGLLVAEVQTPSDTTYRVYDWGRTGRQLHFEEALACIQFGPSSPPSEEESVIVERAWTTTTRLVACDFFHIHRMIARSAFESRLDHPEPVLWMVLHGGGELLGADHEPIPFRAGETIFFPPGARKPQVRCDAQTTWLEVTLPGSALPLLA